MTLPLDVARKPTTAFQIVSPTYFSTLELPIVAGRAFDTRDLRGNPRVAIVNEAFARNLGKRNPIGLQVTFKPVEAPNAKPNTVQIVGVAKQVKFRPDESRDYVQMYVPLAQDPVDDMLMLVRSKTGRAGALTPAVRTAISRIDKEQLVSVAEIKTLEDVEWAATGRHRFRAVMVALFAALAVTLAMVGIFGILAYSVQQRMRDFGVRRALGATTNDVLHLVIYERSSLDWCRRGRGPGPGCHLQPIDRNDVVWRAAAGCGHVRSGRGRIGDHRRARDRRSGVARRADRSGSGASRK